MVKKKRKPLSPCGQLCFMAAIIWEIGVAFYFCLTKPLEIKLTDSEWIILVLLIIFPPVFILLTQILSLILLKLKIPLLAREQHLDERFNEIAKLIDHHLGTLEENANILSMEMIGKFVKIQHPYLITLKEDAVEWQEEDLSQFTFTVMDAFNGESAVKIKGLNDFRGFYAMFIYHNQNVKRVLFLDLKATASAKRLKKIMVNHFGYFDFGETV